MTIITEEKMQNLDIDIQNAGEAINEKKVIVPRYGDPFNSFPLAIEKVENMGGYISAATLAELNTRTPSYNYQLARVDETGDEYRWNPTPAPGAWQPTGKNWLSAAKNYADQQDLFYDNLAKLLINSKVELPQIISQYLVNKSPDVTAPKFGSVTPANPYTNVAPGTYILLPQASIATTIKRFSIISGVASGDIELRTYTGSGSTFTMQKSIGTLHVTKVRLIGIVLRPATKLTSICLFRVNAVPFRV